MKIFEFESGNNRCRFHGDGSEGDGIWNYLLGSFEARVRITSTKRIDW